MEIHLIVCVKSVILNAPTGKILRSSDSCELNPYDRPALETALRIRDELGGSVTAVSMGPHSCAFALYEAMAMGVDNAVLVCDPALAGSDTLATSSALAAAVKKLSPVDMVFFGTRSADSDTGQVGPQTAVLLDLPLVTNVHAWECKDHGLIVQREADGFLERLEIGFPGVLTINPVSAPPRDLGLASIDLVFKQGQVQKWSLRELGLPPGCVGEAGSGTRVLALSRADRARKCEFLEGEAEAQVDRLVERLLESGLI
ncbi:MAG: electron transfer flavoprotein subunit beta/FixA family protein [Desulfatiglandaceae bacterium]|jgi:electron transfer flavoprotein beta subunit